MTRSARPANDPGSPATPGSSVGVRRWFMLCVFVFFCLELAIMALAIKGSAFVLLVGSIVCGVQAVDVWREIRAVLKRTQPR